MSVTAVPIRPLKKGAVLRLWLALVLLALLAVGLAWYGTAPMQFQETDSGLQYRVVKEGDGKHPADSDIVAFDYTLTVDGKVVESSKGQQPQPVSLAGLIPGFKEGLQLMSKGATYRLRIPPHLGYGDQGGGPIPPNSTLDFEITLIGFMPMAQYQSMMGGMMGGGPPPPR